jgi:hypothetical protein
VGIANDLLGLSSRKPFSQDENIMSKIKADIYLCMCVDSSMLIFFSLHIVGVFRSYVKYIDGFG